MYQIYISGPSLAHPANIYLLKINDRNIRESYEMFKINYKNVRKTPIRSLWCFYC